MSTEDGIEKIFSEAKRLSLTADERSSGREMLRSYMALTPMKAAAVPAKRPLFGFANVWTGRTATALSVSLAVLLSAGGVSYAAEGALPGDLLYPVKVGVNEEARAAIAVSPQAKAAWEAERAERRLDEAERLAARGTLGAETRASLEADFRGHAERAQEHIAALEESSDVEAAADVNAHLEGSLHAHKKIIAMLENVDGELEASVDHEIKAAEEARGKNEARVAAEGSDEAKSAAQGRRGAAVRKIAEVRAYLEAKSGKLGAEATADAVARLADADASVAEGDAKLAAGDNGAAFAAYAKAQRQAQEAKLLIRAGHDLKIKARSEDAKLEGDADVNASIGPVDEVRPRDERGSDRPRGDDGSRDGSGSRGDEEGIKLDLGGGKDWVRVEGSGRVGL